MSQGDDIQGNNIQGDRPREVMVLAPELLQLRSADDEVSLFDLWTILARKRNLILVVFFVVLSASVAISFLIPPVYQVSIHFRAPLKSDIQPLDILEFNSGDSIESATTGWVIVGKTPLTSYTVEEVFDEFQRNFIDRKNLWAFFNDKQLYKTYLEESDTKDADIKWVFESYFLQALSMHRPKSGKDDPMFIYASLDWGNPADGAALLNEYGELILSETAEQFLHEVQAQLASEKARVQKKIDLLRASEKRQIRSRLAELEENISIARELGVKRSKVLEERSTSEVSVNVSEEQPLYYQGYEVLEAEKRALLAREDNDPFIDGLEAQLRWFEYLNAIDVTGKDIQAARIIQKASVPNQPIKPKKKQIVVLGFVLGLMLGVLAAFISNFTGKVKEHASSH
jgi:LPS O-antigen subunit length determinant protein (WzzB/FepE family)